VFCEEYVLFSFWCPFLFFQSCDNDGFLPIYFFMHTMFLFHPLCPALPPFRNLPPTLSPLFLTFCFFGPVFPHLSHDIPIFSFLFFSFLVVYSILSIMWTPESVKTMSLISPIASANLT
jgi:hypothetical protein